MSATVWKYDVPLGFDCDRELPRGARVVHVAAQHPESAESVQFWAEVDTTQPMETRQFFIAGTGHPVRPEAIYLGTAIVCDGELVWHLYEVPR